MEGVNRIMHGLYSVLTEQTTSNDQLLRGLRKICNDTSITGQLRLARLGQVGGAWCSRNNVELFGDADIVRFIKINRYSWFGDVKK